MSLVFLGLAHAANAQEATPGAPQQGVQATITADRTTYATRDPIRVSMTLANVSDRAITIDPWEGNWFVQVYDEAFVPLRPGTYWLGAECWALPDPSHPESWSGLVRSEFTRIELLDTPATTTRE